MSSPDLMKAPTPEEIDTLIANYAEAQGEAMAIGAVAKLKLDAAGVLKAQLTATVEQWGARYTEKSKRLAGAHHTATTTTGTRIAIDPAAVAQFKDYLDSAELPDVVERFFLAHTSYSLVDGPTEVLRTLDLGKRIRAKIAALVGLCFQVKTNAPSLKVDVAELAKP